MEGLALQGETVFMTIDGGKKLHTIEDIMALPEGERAELLNGEMFMMSSPTTTHQDIVGWLYTEIRKHIQSRGGKCKVFPAPFAVFLKNDSSSYVEPDITVICDRSKLDERGCHGIPDWVIEVVSQSSREMDYCRKAEAYSSAGVREYWIVDAEKETVLVYHPEKKETPCRYSFADSVKTGIFQELTVHFEELKSILSE